MPRLILVDRDCATTKDHLSCISLKVVDFRAPVAAQNIQQPDSFIMVSDDVKRKLLLARTVDWRCHTTSGSSLRDTRFTFVGNVKKQI